MKVIKKKAKPSAEDYESLSKYIRELERRIILLEGKTGITTSVLKGGNQKIIKQKQHEIYVQHVIGVINNRFNCGSDDWLKVSRKKRVKELRWILYNILRFNYSMDNYHLISLVLEESFNYKIDRATIYHAFNAFDDMSVLKDVSSESFMSKYEEIKKLL